MDPLLISAASGMKTRMESLDMLANNLANTGTSGFKADREFNSLVRESLPVIDQHWTDFSQGTLLPDGNALHLGLSGKGFFALNSPTGVVYTRNGEFSISNANQLQTSEGFTLRNVRDRGQPIVIDPLKEIAISKEGIVRQGGQEIGQIEISGIDSASTGLRKQGTSYYALAPKNGNAAPSPATGVEVHQGTLEQSNVPVGDAAVRLISVMRQFEMLQRAMTLGSEMNKRAIDEVAKI